MKVQPYSFYLLDNGGHPIGSFEMEISGDYPKIDDRIFQIALSKYADGLSSEISLLDYKSITHFIKKIDSRTVIIGFYIENNNDQYIKNTLKDYINRESFNTLIEDISPEISDFKRKLNKFLIILLMDLDQQSTQHFASLIQREFATYHVYS